MMHTLREAKSPRAERKRHVRQEMLGQYYGALDAKLELLVQAAENVAQEKLMGIDHNTSPRTPRSPRSKHPFA
jgi:hypothetical protein